MAVIEKKLDHHPVAVGCDPAQNRRIDVNLPVVERPYDQIDRQQNGRHYHDQAKGLELHHPAAVLKEPEYDMQVFKLAQF